ncbi:tyrosine-type recombinase/integrase [Kitasatospora sp. HPMI-4]|uniref:tyrosine-type recombinase/integrase n=1 Tax=Kitasatospora sp. HPMI-4 TaxID=3448443 RepID=UPI003F1D6B01
MRRAVCTPTARRTGGRASSRCHRCASPLRWRRLQQAKQRETAGKTWEDTGYVFTTRTGRPIELRNPGRSFERIGSDTGLPRIRLHDTRHGCATILFAAGVAPRVPVEIRALADRRDHERLRARLGGHPTRGPWAHGSPAEEAPQEGLTSAVAVSWCSQNAPQRDRCGAFSGSSAPSVGRCGAPDTAHAVPCADLEVLRPEIGCAGRTACGSPRY